MDSTEFENNFNVYSDNKILALQILTSDTMELINGFYKQTTIESNIIIIRDHIYLRFYTGSLFQLKSIKDVLNKNNIYLTYKIFKILFEFSKKVNEKIIEIES